jgi:hypothetical protein
LRLLSLINILSIRRRNSPSIIVFYAY